MARFDPRMGQVRGEEIMLRLDDSHKYFYDDKPVLGLTEILGLCGFGDWMVFVRKDVLERESHLGKAVHKAVELFDKGTLNPASIVKEVAPYLEAWRRFLKDTGAEVFENEMMCYSKVWKYGCILDKTVHLNGLSILELKTTATIDQKSVALQTMGQKIAYEEQLGTKVKNRFCLHLKEDTTYTLHQFKKDGDREAFICCVKVAYFKKGR